MADCELLVLSGVEKGRVFPLQEARVVIGRDPSCHITLDDKEISRLHARIVLHKDSFLLEDLDSRNGTFVNKEKITTQVLRVGDLLVLGQTELTLRRAAQPQQRKTTSPAALLSTCQPTSAISLYEQNSPLQQDKHLTSMMSITTTLSAAEFNQTIAQSHASLRAMYRVIRLASSTVDLDQLLANILDEVFATIRPERAHILLFEPDSEQLEIKASRWQNKRGLERKVSISKHIIDHVLSKRESVLIADAMSDAQFGLAKSVVLHKIRSAMCSPLRGRDRIVGIIHVDTSTSVAEFSQEQLQLFDAIGNAAGIAVENVLLYREKLQNERLAAVGQAISGLSHYIKNILASMEVSASVMERGLDAEDLETIARVWQILRRSNQRISNLVLDMLTYSKERKVEPQPCLVNEICGEIVELCEDRFQAKNAELVVNLDPDVRQIQADPQGLHRCLLNLLSNAMDAIDESGGRVTLSTKRHADKAIEISVADNGHGMSEETKRRIFDVFFSTKGNKGTGLGLAVTKKVVDEHGGRLEVESSPGQGSRFTIWLPVAPNKKPLSPPSG
ncbi:MAG: FHA domain-containing protein [Deltaproteobacteria bacterium]|nr:FHA domain-containing protein [Deltaproteobacteria bacterium]